VAAAVVPLAFFAVVRLAVPAAAFVAGFLARSFVGALSVPRGSFGI
jgi:hypothetical protein